MNKMELLLNIGSFALSLSVIMFYLAFLMSDCQDYIKVYAVMFGLIFTLIGVFDVIISIIKKLINL